MFSAKTYTARRSELRTKIGQGIVLLPGNGLAPNNYPNNAYYFRQDSSFLYYFGLNIPALVGVIDADTGEEALYGDDFTVEDIIWTGPQPTLECTENLLENELCFVKIFQNLLTSRNVRAILVIV